MSALNEIFKGVDENFSVVVDEILKATPLEATTLESPDQIKEQSREMLTDILTGKDLRDRMEQGFSILVRELSAHETPVIIDNIKAEWVKYTEDMINKMQNTLKEHNSEEETLKAFEKGFHISNDTMDRFYSCGVRLYQHKKYQEAADVFFVISSIDYQRHNVWMALGLSEQELGHHELALTAFSMAALTDIEDPLAFLYSAECYIALGETKDAHECIETALDLVKDKTDNNSKNILDQLISIKKSLK